RVRARTSDARTESSRDTANHVENLAADDQTARPQVGRGHTDLEPADREQGVATARVAHERRSPRVPLVALVLERDLPLRKRSVDPRDEATVVPNLELRHWVRDAVPTERLEHHPLTLGVGQPVVGVPRLEDRPQDARAAPATPSQALQRRSNR